MDNTPEFPNGFTSWYETFYEIVDMILSSDEYECNKVYEIEREQGRGGLWEFAYKLTQEFEEKYKNHQWDGEYFECLEQFFNEKNQI